jgi:hypothetical protein
MHFKIKPSGILSLAVLVAGVSACATAGPPPPPPPPAPVTTPCDMKPHDQVIDVGASVGCKLSLLHLKLANNGKGNTMLWRAVDPHMNVKITFDTPLFPDLSCPGTQHVCQSGALDPNTPMNEHYVSSTTRRSATRTAPTAARSSSPASSSFRDDSGARVLKGGFHDLHPPVCRRSLRVRYLEFRVILP